MKYKRLHPDEWGAIRKVWEFDPAEPTYVEAARQVAEKHGFVAPGKTTIETQAKRKGWERKGNLKGINEAAQRKADKLVNADGSAANADGADSKNADGSATALATAARNESEDKRADVLARHRLEWGQIYMLRQEAVQRRQADATDAFTRMKLAKITAETTMIQQVGERRAWGMDTPDATDVSRLTDTQLEALIKGKAA